MKKNSYNSIDSNRVFLWSLLLPQVVSIVMALIFSLFYKSQEELSSSLVYLFFATIVAQVCFAFIVFFYNKKNNFNFLQASKLKTKPSVQNIFGCVAISIIAVFGFVNFINMFSGWFTAIGFNQASVSLPINTFYWLIINVVLLAVVPAFMEECIFRGIIFNGFRKRGFWFATIISACMFAIVHLNIKQLLFPLIMGVVFAMVLEKTGSIMYTIIVHFCNNFIVLLISYINQKTGNNLFAITVTNVPLALFVVLIACVAMLLIVLIVKFVLKKPKSTSDDEINNIVEVCDANELTNIDKKSQNKAVVYSLAIGLVVWLVYALSELLV